jgi:uncharacterized protein (TIGR00251 family)
MSDPAFLRRTASGVLIDLRVQPRARRTALLCDPAGVLKAAVTAPAEDGKANAAVIELLAREWRLAKKAIEVVRGATARQKVLAIEGQPDDVAANIATWLQQRGGGAWLRQS